MKSFKIPLFVLASFVMLLVSYGQAQAKELENIQFPIEDLGGCESRQACKTYCDDPANMDKCLAFAEQKGIMSKTEVTKARSYAKVMKEKLEFPGGAKNPAEAKKYCEDRNHMEECLAFAEKHGLIEPEELKQAKKFMPLMKSGQTPGGCQSKEECESYCQNENNFEECASFAQKHGLVSAEEIEKFKRIQKEGGPGGCKGKKACEQFCNNPDNQKDCLEFAEKHGFVKPEEAKQMRENLGRVRTGEFQVPPEVETCLTSALGAETFAQMKEGKMMPGPEIGEKMKECFESFKGKTEEHSRAQAHNVSPEVKTCIREKAGSEDLMEEMGAGEALEPEKADLVRACFEKFTNKEDPRDREAREREQNRSDGDQPPIGGFGQGMPEAVKACVQAKVGQDASQADKDALTAAAHACSEAARMARPEEMNDRAEKENQEKRGLLDRLRGKPSNDQERYRQEMKDNPKTYENQRQEYLKTDSEGQYPKAEYQRQNQPAPREQKRPEQEPAFQNPPDEHYPDPASYPKPNLTPSADTRETQ